MLAKMYITLSINVNRLEHPMFAMCGVEAGSEARPVDQTSRQTWSDQSEC